jgi:hypothetical protein
VAYRIDDLAAAVSSGSFRTIGKIVAPCSLRCLGEIAHGITSNLLTRAAGVFLEERRKLALVAGEDRHTGFIRRGQPKEERLGQSALPARSERVNDCTQNVLPGRRYSLLSGPLGAWLSWALTYKGTSP